MGLVVVGAFVGVVSIGLLVGALEGFEVGCSVSSGDCGLNVGSLLGLAVGLSVVLTGLSVGALEGLEVGLIVTSTGLPVGDVEGLSVGLFVVSMGLNVGALEGLAVGLSVISTEVDVDVVVVDEAGQLFPQSFLHESLMHEPPKLLQHEQPDMQLLRSHSPLGPKQRHFMVHWAQALPRQHV